MNAYILTSFCTPWKVKNVTIHKILKLKFHLFVLMEIKIKHHILFLFIEPSLVVLNLGHVHYNFGLSRFSKNMNYINVFKKVSKFKRNADTNSSFPMVIDDTTYSPCGKNELFHKRMSASIIALFHKGTCCDDAAFYYLTSFFTSFFIHLKVKSLDEKKSTVKWRVLTRLV